METEARESLMKTAPHLLKEVNTQQFNQDVDDGLDHINEDEEEEEDDEVNEEETEEDDLRAGPHTNYEDDDENEMEDEDSFNPKQKSRAPRDSLLDADEELSNDKVRKRNDSLSQDQNFDSNSEVEDNAVKILQKSSAKKEISAEDEEFMKQFDSLLTENIAVGFTIWIDFYNIYY